MSRKKTAVIVTAALVAAVYAGGIYYYNDRVYPRTTADGEDVSGMPVEEAGRIAEEKALTGSVAAKVKDQYYEVARKDLLRVTNHEDVLRAVSHGTAWSWPAEYARDHVIDTGVQVDCAPEQAEQALRAVGILELDIPAKDAYLSDYSAGEGYRVVPDEDGWKAPMEDLIGAFAEAAKNEPQTLDLTDRFKVTAKVTADDKDLTGQAEEKNRLVGRDVPIHCGDSEFFLTGEDLNGWLTRTRDGMLGIDTDKLRAFAEETAEKCREEAGKKTTEEVRYVAINEDLAARLADNLGLTYPEPETDAQKRTRERANDRLMKKAERQAKRTADEAEKAKILADAEKSLTPEPEMISVPLEFLALEAPEASAAPDVAKKTPAGEVKGQAETAGEENGGEAREEKSPEDGIVVELVEASPEFQEGYGLNYVDVDIENQHVMVFENAKLIMETPCVTGTPNKARETHKGVFHIYAMQRNRILRGRERLYESFVNYWMPFDEGIGLHDATWRGSFGGTIYKSSGSHGCVNLPLSFAKELYSKVYVGETVYVH